MVLTAPYGSKEGRGQLGVVFLEMPLKGETNVLLDGSPIFDKLNFSKVF